MFLLAGFMVYVIFAILAALLFLPKNRLIRLQRKSMYNSGSNLNIKERILYEKYNTCINRLQYTDINKIAKEAVVDVNDVVSDLEYMQQRGQFMNIRIIPQENRIEFIQADNNSYMSYSEVNPVYSNIQPSSNIEPPSGQAVYDNNDLDEYTYDDNNSDEYTYDDNYYGNGGTDLGSENSAYGRNADMVDSIALDEIIVECDYCGAPNIVRRNSGSCKCYFCWKEL